MSVVSKPTILVIVGITGDLCRRYVLPALEQLASAHATPEKFRIIGVVRRPVTAAEIRESLSNQGPHNFLVDHLTMHQMDLSSLDDYSMLKVRLEALRQEMGNDTRMLFYLSVPPLVSRPVIGLLGESGLASSVELLIEKPFGIDLERAQELVNFTRRYFKEEQIYRVDHYLAKEMTQNLLVFRECNALFKRTWNKDFIERIDIIASEQIPVAKGREEFYEQTGALRDYQSHLLQMAALLLMEGINPARKQAVPERRLKALQQIHVPTGEPVARYAKRGQYIGYRKQVAEPVSAVETFIDITLASDDPNWTGVPIRIVTGKSLDERFTEIRVTYRKEKDYESNELHIKVQPSAGIALDLWTKVPGYKHRIEKQSLKLSYQDYYISLPQAYEQVFIDAINGNRSLFVCSDEVLESWRILEPIQKAWATTSNDLVLYKPGSNFDNI